MKKSLYLLTSVFLVTGIFAGCEKPKESEYKDYTETAFGMNLEMVYVEGGTFRMGATTEQGDDVYDSEKPIRKIKLDGFYIGKYEVTQAQWEAMMGTTLEAQQALSDDGDIEGEGLDYPMYYVTWNDAQEFCKRLSEATGKQYVLPTEAQWEYAARGGNKSQHYRYSGNNDINKVAWYWENSLALGGDHPDYGTHPVGTKKANELGIYDMSGNVWEWCLDWYASEYDKADDYNPQGPTSGTFRVARGGSWAMVAKVCRVSSRFNFHPDDCATNHLGFRVACLY